MRNVTLVIKFQIDDEQSESEEFREFVNQVRSGEMQRDMMEKTKTPKKYVMRNVTATIEVSKKQKRL